MNFYLKKTLLDTAPTLSQVRAYLSTAFPHHSRVKTSQKSSWEGIVLYEAVRKGTVLSQFTHFVKLIFIVQVLKLLKYHLAVIVVIIDSGGKKNHQWMPRVASQSLIRKRIFA